MAGFLIYRPDGKPDPLEHAGLKGLVRDGDASLQVSAADIKGPDDGVGSLLYFHDPKRAETWPTLGYKPKQQTWKRGPGGNWWLGWQTKSPPTPADLLRYSERADGYLCELNDGRKWAVPCGPMLPIDFDMGDEGQLIEVVKTPWRETYERTLWAFETAQGLVGQDEPITKANRDPIIAYCGWMLSINYRLTATVAAMLGLFDPASLWRCLLLTTDTEKINELIDGQKKIAEPTGAGPDIDSGGSESGE